MNIMLCYSLKICTVITHLLAYIAIFKTFFSMQSILFLCLQHSICKTKAEIKLTSKRDTCINLASEEKRLQNDQPCVLADILGRVFLGSELGRNQY